MKLIAFEVRPLSMHERSSALRCTQYAKSNIPNFKPPTCDTIPAMSGQRLNVKSILYVVFFLSGATGLVYEVIWVRLTGLIFGNTSQAISTVLGAFMAGLALGSWKLGEKADRSENPLRMYGLLEIGIGLSAALVPLIFRALDNLYWVA